VSSLRRAAPRRGRRLVCCALWTIGVLSACGGQSSSTDSTPTIELTTSPAPPATEAPAPSEAVAPIDAVATDAQVANDPVDTSGPVATTDAVAPEPVVTGAAEPGAKAVVFDSPGAEPRPITEYRHPIEAPTSQLAMTIEGITYRGIVCGFTFLGSTPPSPVQIRMTVDKADGSTADSGPVDVRWTAATDDAVTVGSAENADWSFSGAANTNRGAPGWVVSLGGVTPDAEDAVPVGARCTLDADTGFAPEHGPVGYWAGFATT
jgi:hypothetical protein